MQTITEDPNETGTRTKTIFFLLTMICMETLSHLRLCYYIVTLNEGASDSVKSQRNTFSCYVSFFTSLLEEKTKPTHRNSYIHTSSSGIVGMHNLTRAKIKHSLYCNAGLHNLLGAKGHPKRKR